MLYESVSGLLTCTEYGTVTCSCCQEGNSFNCLLNQRRRNNAKICYFSMQQCVGSQSFFLNPDQDPDQGIQTCLDPDLRIRHIPDPDLKKNACFCNSDDSL